MIVDAILDEPVAPPPAVAPNGLAPLLVDAILTLSAAREAARHWQQMFTAAFRVAMETDRELARLRVANAALREELRRYVSHATLLHGEA